MYVCTVRLCKNTPRRPAVFTEDGRIKTSSKRPERCWKIKETLSTAPTYASLHSTDACGKRGHHFYRSRHRERVTAQKCFGLASTKAWEHYHSIRQPQDGNNYIQAKSQHLYKPFCKTMDRMRVNQCKSFEKVWIKFELNHLPKCAQLFVMS